jgi:hypothetical protein
MPIGLILRFSSKILVSCALADFVWIHGVVVLFLPLVFLTGNRKMRSRQVLDYSLWTSKKLLGTRRSFIIKNFKLLLIPVFGCLRTVFHPFWVKSICPSWFSMKDSGSFRPFSPNSAQIRVIWPSLWLHWRHGPWTSFQTRWCGRGRWFLNSQWYAPKKKFNGLFSPTPILSSRLR